jgi:tetratricopeptide (TPR) repeat protein
VGAGITEQRERLLQGRRVALVGKLASMSRRDAEQLIRSHGGILVATVDSDTALAVVSDDTSDLAKLSADFGRFDGEIRSAGQASRIEVVRESDFWARLGLVDAGEGVARLYTPAMLAELLRVPVAGVRQWHRKGHLRATREVRRLPYFDFEEVCIARKLAELLAAGCSLALIDRKLAELARLYPEVPRPLADVALVVEGRSLYVRRGESLTEPSGQLLLDFDVLDESADSLADSIPDTVSISSTADEVGPPSHSTSPAGLSAYDLRSLAADLEERGERSQAIETYRTVLMSGGFAAEDHFFLAELLYRAGDLQAARERYYAAIELDEDYVEARANLGCVLAELGEASLAEASFRGALVYHPDYADAHFHLARLLDRLERRHEAAQHWGRFLELAPASPWANEAHDRVAGMPSS